MNTRNPSAPGDFAALGFENSFVRDLPGDAVALNRPRQVSNAAYTRVDPTPVRQPRILAWSDALGEQLGIARPDFTGLVAEVLAGSRVLPGMQPYAARYGGHQFGNWAGQLGDGRAITLAEIVARDGTRQELQLKGAGPTPYSRTADGRAVLRSSVREFMCSEAMHFLGIPTTRALSLAATGEPVIRDMFYDGNAAPEPGAVVCRVAPSFVRFGNFQIFAATREHHELRKLADWVMRNHFPGIEGYEKWFDEICRRTALLMIDWMRVGFVHGVMNTDNMSILGVTIDYGPYGWLEGYDPGWTPNTTDAQTLRYTYANQPGVAQWNLARLGEALLPLVGGETAALEDSLKHYAETFNTGWRTAVARKLGLSSLDDDLLNDMMVALQQEETDFTIFFRKLADVPLDSDDASTLLAPLVPAFYQSKLHTERKVLADWLLKYAHKAREDDVAPARRRETMLSANPKYVFRNYLAINAIEALENNDASVLERLYKVLQRPYDEQPEHEDLAARRPEWARTKAGCSALSCSS